jgi:hypothetical protein
METASILSQKFIERKILLGVIGRPANNAQGNKLTKEAFEKYLKSETWTYQKRAKNIVGGITHIGRTEPDGYFGYSDELFKNHVITHVITDIWIEGNNIYGTVRIFTDMSMYSDSQKADILQLLRLVDNEVEVGCSLVIDGEWGKSNAELVHIYTIVGLDFTLDPAYFTTRILN